METVLIEARIVLVPHGYQIDIYDHARATEDGQGVYHSTACRDFAGDYDPAIVATSLTSALLDTMKNLERTHLGYPHAARLDR